MQDQTTPQSVQSSTFSQNIAAGMQWLGIFLAGVGTIVLLGESAFLADPFSRFFAFSTIIIISAGLGQYLAYYRADTKNAAILVGMFLACVPIFWSQFGALVYAASVGVSTQVPQLLQMPIPSTATLLQGGAIALLAILPLSVAAARIFMPRESLRYAAMVSALGVAICIPVRTGTTAQFLLVVSSLAIFFCERHWLIASENGATLKGKFARAVVIALGLLLFVRGEYYQPGAVADFSCYLTVAIVLHWLFTLFASERTLGAFVADCLAAFAIANLTRLSSGSVDPSLENILSYAIPSLFLLAQGAGEEKEQWLWRTTAVLVLAYFGYILRDDNSLLSQIAAFGFSLGGVIYAYRTRSTFTLFITTALFLGNFTWLIDLLLKTLIEYRWSILMISGISLVFGSSYVEHGIKKIRHHWSGK